MEIDKKEIKGKNILVIGGGIMGLGSAWYLSQRWLKVEIHFLWILATNIVYTKILNSKSSRGYRVTILEKNKDVAQVASSINGAMICPSMCASWASMKLLSKVRL